MTEGESPQMSDARIDLDALEELEKSANLLSEDVAGAWSELQVLAPRHADYAAAILNAAPQLIEAVRAAQAAQYIAAHGDLMTLPEIQEALIGILDEALVPFSSESPPK